MKTNFVRVEAMAGLAPIADGRTAAQIRIKNNPAWSMTEMPGPPHHRRVMPGKTSAGGIRPGLNAARSGDHVRRPLDDGRGTAYAASGRRNDMYQLISQDVPSDENA